MFLGGAISADWTNGSVEVTRRLQKAWAWLDRYSMEINVSPSLRLRLKVRMLTAEVFATLLYGCVTWSRCKPEYDRLQEVHHNKLFRCIGCRTRKREDHVSFYPIALLRTNPERLETTVRRRWLLFASFYKEDRMEYGRG